MKLSAQEEYGLRCLVQVARRQGQGPVPIRVVAECEGLSLEYAAKLMRALRKANLVDSQRGASGGYTLSRPAAEISIYSVLTTLDSPLYTEEFCTGHTGKLSSCAHGSAGCSIRVLWQWMDAALQRSLERVSLADLAMGPNPVRSALNAPAPDASASATQPEEAR